MHGMVAPARSSIGLWMAGGSSQPIPRTKSAAGTAYTAGMRRRPANAVRAGCRPTAAMYAPTELVSRLVVR